MSITSYRRLTGILVALALVLALLCGWLVWQFACQSIEVVFADEQTGIFEEMTTQALQSKPAEAADCLKYVLGYYPSGTKQQAGSRLDRMVERQRAQAVREIIACLRRKTGEDLGEVPQQWIRKFGNR
jgi:hypothetical protein